MQTFLPYPDFVLSAACLDSKRLGKQRVEAWQIYLTLSQGSRWIHHPAVKMWKGYEKALLFYALACCQEWVNRGYKDTISTKILSAYKSIPGEVVYPWWFGNKDFHESHRSNLLRKNWDHYSYQFSIDGIDLEVETSCREGLQYVWPVR